MHLSRIELNNLLTFLSRCDLKGNEVPTYVSLITKLTKALGSEEEVSGSTDESKA